MLNSHSFIVSLRDIFTSTSETRKDIFLYLFFEKRSFALCNESPFALHCGSEELVVRVILVFDFSVLPSDMKLNATYRHQKQKKKVWAESEPRETEDSVLKGWKRDWASAAESVWLCWAFVSQRERCWMHHGAGSCCWLPKTDQVQEISLLFSFMILGYLCSLWF